MSKPKVILVATLIRLFCALGRAMYFEATFRGMSEFARTVNYGADYMDSTMASVAT